MTSANKDLNQKIDAFLQQIKMLAKDMTERLSKLTPRCQALFDAATKISESWSGSYFGYHSELYYGDFEKPPLHAAFSPEWGGINGISEGWRSHTAEEVKTRIESMGGNQFDTLDNEAGELLRLVQEFQQETIIDLSVIHDYKGFEKEKELLGRIEKYAWGITTGEYMHANLPKNFMSRDSEAVHQGVRMPAYLCYEAEAFALKSRCATITDFLKLSERLLRQIQIKLPATQSEPTEKLTVRTANRTTASRDFDVALSFAGTERSHAEELATRIRAAGYQVFYDDFYPEQLWGKDLVVARIDNS